MVSPVSGQWSVVTSHLPCWEHDFNIVLRYFVFRYGSTGRCSPHLTSPHLTLTTIVIILFMLVSSVGHG